MELTFGLGLVGPTELRALAVTVALAVIPGAMVSMFWGINGYYFIDWRRSRVGQSNKEDRFVKEENVGERCAAR